MLCGENVEYYMSIYVICLCCMYGATVFVRFVFRLCVKRALFACTVSLVEWMRERERGRDDVCYGKMAAPTLYARQHVSM